MLGAGGLRGGAWRLVLFYLWMERERSGLEAGRRQHQDCQCRFLSILRHVVFEAAPYPLSLDTALFVVLDFECFGAETCMAASSGFVCRVAYLPRAFRHRITPLCPRRKGCRSS